MKSLVCGLVCAGVLCAGVSVTRGEEKAAPPAQDEIAQLKAQVQDVEKKLNEVRKTAAATDEMKAMKKTADEAGKAVAEAKKAKLAANEKYGAAVKAIADAEAKLNAMGCNSKGQPKDAAKVLSEQEKADAEAAVKAIKEAKDQKNGVEKELSATDEMKKLEQAQKDAGKAYEDGLRAKVAADPSVAPLMKEKEDLQAKIKAAASAQPKKEVEHKP